MDLFMLSERKKRGNRIKTQNLNGFDDDIEKLFEMEEGRTQQEAEHEKSLM